MDHNCPNRPGWKKRVINFLARAVRSIIGMIFVAGIATMCIRHYHESKYNGKCEKLRSELEKLKHRKIDARAPPPSTETDVGNPAHCSSGNHHNPDMDTEIRDIIREELASYLADKTGMPDFAMENLGGCVLTTRDTKTFGGENDSFMNIFSKYDPIPNRILRPDMTPGSCWAFEGNHGAVVIKLMSFVLITHVTLEHITPKLVPSEDITSAPKTFTLWGLRDPEDPFGKHKFGTFEYNKDGRPVQTFPVQLPTNKSYRIVEVTFHDNHGNVEYTCVYRVRIHGEMDRDEDKLAGNPPLRA